MVSEASCWKWRSSIICVGERFAFQVKAEVCENPIWNLIKHYVVCLVNKETCVHVVHRFKSSRLRLLNAVTVNLTGKVGVTARPVPNKKCAFVVRIFRDEVLRCSFADPNECRTSAVVRLEVRADDPTSPPF